MNTEILFQTLEIMGKGMLSIFVVILVIYLVVLLMLKICKKETARK